jgi:glucosamine kinase
MKFKIGVDGGGTKTEGVLVDDAGNVAAIHVGAGSNPSLVGVERARSVVSATLDSLRAQAGGLAQADGSRPEITATLLCMAGSPTTWQEFAGGLAHFGRVTTVDDSGPVLELATRGQPGLVLHAGTGSFVAARGPAGTVHYAGGLGWRLGDPGSAHDIGRRGIARGLLDLQAGLGTTKLAQALCQHMGLDDAAAITRKLYQDPEAAERIAPFAPVVLQLAATDNPAAKQVVVQSALELLDIAVRLGEQLFSETMLDRIAAGLSGPILTQPAVRDVLAQRAPFPLAPVEGTPIEGVRRMLAEME